MTLTLEHEKLDDIPEDQRESFVEHNGKFVHKDFKRLIDDKKRVLDSQNETKTALEAANKKLQEFEEAEQKRAEEIRKAEEAKMSETERKKLEDERRETRERELIEIAENAKAEAENLKNMFLKKEAETFAAEVKDKFKVAKGFEKAFSKLYAMERTKIVDGQFTPTNEKGEAVGRDIESIVKALETDEMFSGMKAGPGSTPDPLRNNPKSQGFKMPENKKYSDLSTSEKVAYLKAKKETAT